MSRCNVVAIANQKGGVAKTTTTANLGIALALSGKKALCIDADPQGDLTCSLGWQDQDSIDYTLATVLGKAIAEDSIDPKEGILHHEEGIDLLPSNIELSALELTLVNTMSREYTLKGFIDQIRPNYDFILIDCMPSLGMITINALTSADSVIIPVQSHYLPVKGMTQLIKTVNKVKRQVNPQLRIAGILPTLVDERTNIARSTIGTIRESYGGNIPLFNTEVPFAVSAAEATMMGKSVLSYDKNGKVAKAYSELAKEVLSDGKNLTKTKSTLCR